jgi:glyoxylase-like metal-dependent hydrolase (beta-lactamase superfamily II)/8-oxo-dGTP pyrophosphatase MutT (NUDIX family)
MPPSPTSAARDSCTSARFLNRGYDDFGAFPGEGRGPPGPPRSWRSGTYDCAVSEPRPAATVVLLRNGPGGLEVLLTHRPATMAFAPDVHVFPGGRVDAADFDPGLQARSIVSAADAAVGLGGDLPGSDALAAYNAAIREAFEEVGVLLADVGVEGDLVAARRRLLDEPASFPDIAAALDLRLRTDLLVPLSRWVTPPILDRRFDARFFVASTPEASVVSLVGDEVVAHGWHRPIDALESMAAGKLAMWLPTSTTLTQLLNVTSIEEVRTRMAPGRLGRVVVDAISDDIVRIEMPAGGGIAGQPVNAYLVGRRRFVLIDPGDPTGDGLDRAVAEAAGRGGSIAAIALTHTDPDHAAGAESLREQLGIEVLVGPDGGRHLSYPVRELGDGAVIDDGDVAMRVVGSPGVAPDHLAYVVVEGQFVVAGDLDGRRGARSVVAAPDDDAWKRSVAVLRSAAPEATWLGGHPPVTDDRPAATPPGSAAG